ncbi:MAG TPA: helix-turn-helix transcriptional regulator [Nitrosomonas sp.]|nr:helix-turn-helix transcriptional regulator [Nitrosomonas sp.]
MNHTPGQYIFMLRKLANMTQVELSKRSGVSQSNISKVEHDSKGVMVDDFIKLLDAMGRKIKIVRKK